MLTEMDILKSVVLFLLDGVDEKTTESSLEIYARWQKSSRIVIRNPYRAAWILEYFEMQKNFPRDDIREAARLDGFLQEETK